MFKIKGKIIHVGEVKSGISQAGKNWSSCEFAIEYKDGEYQNLASFKTFNATVIDLLKVGAVAEVSFSPKAREYQGRYYTDLNCYKLEVERSGKVDAPVSEQPF